MKFTLKNKSGENIMNLMRQARYHLHSQSKDGSHLSFTRSVGSSAYPRFHIYLKENKESGEISCILHLDQKRPIYKGASHAHNADYEGRVVEKEAERIKKSLKLYLNCDKNSVERGVGNEKKCY